VYEEFLDILHAYQQKRTIDDVYARVQTLFAGHADLLEEFSYFLPDGNGNMPAMGFHQQQQQQMPSPQQQMDRRKLGRKVLMPTFVSPL
jgi:paired amphipathic helix protein Sin3a